MMKLVNTRVQSGTADRIFMIIRVLLTVSPFIALGYLSMDAAKEGAGGNIQAVISSNPSAAVMFIVAMLNPFIAYLLGFIKDHLHDGDYDYAVANMFLMIIAELMIQNFIYVLMLMFLTYKCVKTYQIPVKGIVKRMAGNHLLRDISGSLVVLAFAGICMFAMLRLG